MSPTECFLLPHAHSFAPYLPRFRMSNRTVVRTLYWERVPWFYQNTGYSELSQNHVEYIQYSVASRQLILQGSHETEVSYLYFYYIFGSTVCYTRDFFVIRLRSTRNFSYAHIVFVPDCVLWLLKQTWILKCLLQSSQGIRIPAGTYGGLAFSNYMSGHMHVTSFVHPFLHALHTCRFAMAPFRFVITW